MISSIFNLPMQHKLQQNVSLNLSTAYATATSAGLSTVFFRHLPTLIWALARTSKDLKRDTVSIFKINMEFFVAVI